MEKIKKGYNLKIILLLIAVLFLLSNTVCAIDFFPKSNLRAPLLFNSSEDKEDQLVIENRLILYLLQALGSSTNYGTEQGTLSLQQELILLAFKRVAGPVTAKMFIEPFLPMKWEALLSELPFEVREGLERELSKNSNLLKDVFHEIQEHELVIPSAIIRWLLGFEEKTFRPLGDSIYGNELTYLDLPYLGFANTPYTTLQELLREIRLAPSDVFIDIGSGDGSAVLYTALTTEVGHVKGIELVRERAQQAENAKEKRHVTNAQFIQGNIRDHLDELDDGTVFYLYNPFIETTWSIVEQKLKAIAAKRKIRIISIWEGPAEIGLNNAGWLKLSQIIHTHYSTIHIYESLDYSAAQDSVLDGGKRQPSAGEFVYGVNGIIERLNERKEPIIALGDSYHGAESLNLFAAKIAQGLNGLTHIVLEDHEDYQADVDEYLKTGQMTRNLRYV